MNPTTFIGVSFVYIGIMFVCAGINSSINISKSTTIKEIKTIVDNSQPLFEFNGDNWLITRSGGYGINTFTIDKK